MKKILSLGLALVMLFVLVACTPKETESKLAELEAKLQEQSSKIDALEEEKDNLLGQITQMQGEIGGLQGEVERLEEERENDYNQLCALSSNLYTLQEAYEKGLITKEDLKAICYFRCGELLVKDENGVTTKVTDYEPNFELGELDKETKRKIQGVLAYWHRGEDIDGWNGTAEDVSCDYYYGTYNKCVVVQVVVGLSDIPQDEKYLEIDGIVFGYTGWLPKVWVENDY